MDSVLKKFRLRKERRESEARQRLKKELFAFNTCVSHGFPNKPSALAYDPKLRLLAIGTRSGVIRVYGSPGVEYSGQLIGFPAVTHVSFLPGQGRLVTVCADGSLHLWQINDGEGQSVMSLVKSLTSATNSNLKSIHACCVTSNCDQLLLGVDNGDILVVDILSVKLTEKVIHREAVIIQAPEDYKSNPGTIVDVLQHPTCPSKFLIGYSRGLIVLWDDSSSVPTHTYNTSQQLESLSFFRDGREFISAHADGSYIIWGSAEVTRQPDLANTPYGPFPCKAISRILYKSAKPEPFIIFSGGMPRASHGEKHTVSVMQGTTHVVFDFSSKVVAFRVLCSGDEMGPSEYDDPHSLVVLTEEELVVVDLTSDGWLTYNLPYLNSIHSSAILCTSHVANVPEHFWNKLVTVGTHQFSGYSTREWPICGGKNLHAQPETHELLLTGHEDGSVRFWDVSTTSMSLIYKLSTSVIFGFEVPQLDMTKSQELEDEWPPFRKVGTYDPYSDDPQLGIQKISICCRSETLILGGTAGQIIILSFNPKQQKHDIQVSSMNIVADNDSYVWKGHEPLSVQSQEITYPSGFQPAAVVQVHPPSLCMSLAVHTEWKLLAVGTAFGYALFDYHQNNTVFTKCTLTAAGEGVAPRRKSLKKSIRESFRRLRGRRAGQHHKTEHRAKGNEGKVHEAKAEQPMPSHQKREPEDEGQIEVAPTVEIGEASSPPSPSGASPSASPKHIEQKTESRMTDDMTTSVARCIYFADTFLLNAQEHSATLWVGTNAGTVFIHQIVLPTGANRNSETVSSTLAKEIQLRHGAPVILISVTDRTMLPLSEPLMLEQGKAPDMSGGHQVVICSEEKFKLYSLPNLKPSTKFRHTARDGTKVRRANLINFSSKSDENYVEHDLACQTSTNQIQVFTVPPLRSQLKGDINGSDSSAVSSGLFTINGEGFFLQSVSEFVRLSLSARFINKPLCTIGVNDSSRPALLLEVADNGHHQEDGGLQPVLDIRAAPSGISEEAVDQSSPATAVVVVAAAGHSDDENKTSSAAATSELSETVATASTSSTTAMAPNATGELIPSETVKMQLSESSTSAVIVRNVVSSRTVVTKTTISTTTDDGTVTETSTNVQHTNTGHVHMSGDDSVIPITQDLTINTTESQQTDSERDH